MRTLIAAAQKKDNEQERCRDSQQPQENVANRSGLITCDDTLGQTLHQFPPRFPRANEVPM
jgi:hypothetical protein